MIRQEACLLHRKKIFHRKKKFNLTVMFHSKILI